MQTQEIFKAKAEAALGGVPTHPPLAMRTVSPMGSPEAVAKRDAYTAAQKAAQAAVVPAPLPVTGHPTFDQVPVEILGRRQKVAALRAKLAGLIGTVQAAAAELLPILEELDGQAAELKSAELFEPAVARKFLHDLTDVISGLSHKTKPKKGESK